MSRKNLKKSTNLTKKNLYICKIGLIVLFFLFPFNALASPISKAFLINLTNKSRKNHNLPILVHNSVLEQAALNKAKDILNKQYFAHTSPSGKVFNKWIEEAGYNYIYAGENLAIDFDESETIMKAWLESPTHRDNILNANYTEIGIAVLGGNFENHPTTVVVQIFGKPQIKLNAFGYYSLLEKQTLNPLIKGPGDKSTISLALDKEDGFMLNTPLFLEEANKIEESQAYSLNNASNFKNNEKAYPTESFYKAVKSNSVNSPISEDIFFQIILTIITASILGSIIEKRKKFAKHRKQAPYPSYLILNKK